jgi:hypothetical protein
MSFGSPFPDLASRPPASKTACSVNLGDADDDRVALVDAATRTDLSYAGLVRRIDAFAGALSKTRSSQATTLTRSRRPGPAPRMDARPSRLTTWH